MNHDVSGVNEKAPLKCCEMYSKRILIVVGSVSQVKSWVEKYV